MSKDLDPDFCNLSATPPSSLEDSPTSTAVPPEKRKKIVFIQPGQPCTSVPISIPATSTRIPQITRTIEPRASSSNEPTVPTKQSKLILARTIPTTSVPQRKLSTQPRITTKVPEKSSLPLPMNVAQHTHKKVILVGRKVPTKSSLGIQQTTTAIPSVQQPSSRNPNQPTRKVPERFVYQPLKQQPTSALKKVPPTTSLPVQPTTLTSTVVQPRAMPQPTKPLPTEPLPPEPLPTEPLPAEPQPPTINSKLDAIMRQLDGLQMSVENLDKRSRRIEKSVGLVQVTTDQVKNCVCNRVLQAHQEEEFEFELLNNVEELKEFNEKLSDPQYEVKIFTWANGRIASEAPETRMQEALNFCSRRSFSRNAAGLVVADQ
ncbi:proteoglycan 4-like [Anopheles arabiensis]|uniref:proteoglycan 4-like n=1 Tax=Anopheles arabiensis TaxID=7173 RepID=UPI001AAC46A9|nr:proteoglycan 4-like [Anopheles arabiensis]